MRELEKIVYRMSQIQSLRDKSQEIDITKCLNALNLNITSDKKGGDLVLLTSNIDFDYLDPTNIYTGRDVGLFSTLLYRTLVVYGLNEKGEQILVPDLATTTGTYTPSADKTKCSWTFTLKSGIKYSNGSNVTCEDIKYAISRSFAPNDGPQYFVSYLNIPKDNNGVSIYKGPFVQNTSQAQAAFDAAIVVSSNTITFNLNKNMSDFNYVFTYLNATPILKSYDVNNAYDTKPLSTGPYKISLKNTKEYIFEANSEWSSSTDSVRKSYPKKIIVKLNQNSDFIEYSIAFDNIPSGVDIDGINVKNLELIHKNYTMENRLLWHPDPYVRYASLNCQRVNNLKVRKALFYAYDHSYFQTVAGEFGGYTPHDNPISKLLTNDYAPTTIGNDSDPNWKITGNVTYAQALLAQAKSESAAAADLVNRITNPDPSGGLIWALSSSTDQSVKDAIINMYAKIGVVVKFPTIPANKYYSTVLAENAPFDVINAGWGADWANASTVLPELFLETGGFNVSRTWFDDPAAYNNIKTQIDLAMNTTDRNAQSTKWKAISQLVMERFYAVKLNYSKVTEISGSNVGDLSYSNALGSIDFNTLYLKSK